MQEPNNTTPSPPAHDTACSLPHDLKALTFSKALDALRQAQQATAKLNNEPNRLPLSQLVELPKVFQIRSAEVDERHVSDLLKALNIHGALDPIVVWRCGRRNFVVDGHHRVAAYRLWRKSKELPVVFFKGTVDEAIEHAETVNGKATLGITYEERSNYAWKLVVHAELLGRLSKAQLVKRANIAKGTIDNMRAAFAALGERAVSLPGWRDAMTEWKKGLQDGDQDFDESWQEAEAMKIADRLGKEFGKRLAKKPDVTAKAFNHLLGRKAREVALLMLEEEGLSVILRDEDGNEVDDLDRYEQTVRELPEIPF
ncbi:ParB/RepB/Spo0J family partition protein [Rhizobium laguerreae]|uniref:ParB/RepB/Spo0J family partition protein n=1 Tax=Rhizobium laguerreae TaxID=1076926 RepID=UPI001C916CA4|nr:ParB/RepB/Spo0J family partition protein [Rhizobium laguerreae]MBY3053347.1 ParB N-terminal domain-containing protein [Rhizobium laguerreae]